MKQTLTKLVDVIRQRLAEQPDKGTSEGGIRTWLQRQGYSKPDIEAALKMIEPRPSIRREPDAPPPMLRQLSGYEQYRLSPKAQAALARLELYEMIDPYEREMLIERLEQFEGEVTMADLDYLIHWLICPTRDIEHQRTLLAVLTGDIGATH